MGKQDRAVHIRLLCEVLCGLDPLVHIPVIDAVYHLLRHRLVRILMMHLLESIGDEIAGADVHLLIVVEYFLHRLLQKRHDVHPENMESFALRGFLHILKEKFRVFHCLFRSGHQMAHEECIQFIRQGCDRIVVLSQGKLRPIVFRCLPAVRDRLCDCFLRDLLSCHFLQESLQLSQLVRNIFYGVLIFLIRNIDIKALASEIIFQIRKCHHVAVTRKVRVDRAFRFREKSAERRSEEHPMVRAHGLGESLFLRSSQKCLLTFRSGDKAGQRLHRVRGKACCRHELARDKNADHRRLLRFCKRFNDVLHDDLRHILSGFRQCAVREKLQLFLLHAVTGEEKSPCFLRILHGLCSHDISEFVYDIHCSSLPLMSCCAGPESYPLSFI